MNIFNSAETIGAVALGLVVGMIVLLILQARSSTQINKLTFPAYEFTIKKAENEANEIIKKAQEQAREIVAKAELESSNLLVSRTEESDKEYQVYVASLENFRENLSETLEKMVEETENRSQEISNTFVSRLDGQSQEMQKKVQDLAKQLDDIPERLRGQSGIIMEGLQERIARAGEQLEHSLVTSHTAHTEAIKEHLQKGFEIAELDIEEYRKGRKALIDNHIEVLVKDVVRVVLQKELTRADHAELVQSALEEARSSGAF
jgi:vacuolar-type H+-ATPase subunit H